MFNDIESIESKIFTIEKNFKNKSFILTKLSEIERVPTSAIKVDLTNNSIQYKTIGVREGKFREPKNDELLYFDYGYDLKFFYDELTIFYNDLGYKEIKFLPIENNLAMPIIKYLKLKFKHSSIEILNKFYDCEVLLHSKQLLEIPFVTLSSFFEKKDVTIYLDDMYAVGMSTLNTFRKNKERIFDYIIYTERLYSDSNFNTATIDLLFHYLDKYNFLYDYTNFLKVGEALRHTNDIEELIHFFKAIETKGYDTDLTYEYLDRFNKKSRKLGYANPKKSISLLEDLKIDASESNSFNTSLEAKKLLTLFKNGDILNFSKRVVYLEQHLSDETYGELIYTFKVEFSKVVKI